MDCVSHIGYIHSLEREDQLLRPYYNCADLQGLGRERLRAEQNAQNLVMSNINKLFQKISFSRARFKMLLTLKISNSRKSRFS